MDKVGWARSRTVIVVAVVRLIFPLTNSKKAQPSTSMLTLTTHHSIQNSHLQSHLHSNLTKQTSHQDTNTKKKERKKRNTILSPSDPAVVARSLLSFMAWRVLIPCWRMELGCKGSFCGGVGREGEGGRGRGREREGRTEKS
jgi:hypothetical protein